VKELSEAQRRLRLGRRMAMFSMAASASLCVANILVGVFGGSTSVVAVGVEFAGDVFASAVVFFGMLLAAKPADADHPYGHGRVEILAGFLVGLTILAGGLGICYRSMRNINQVHPPPGLFTIWPLISAIFVKSLLSFFKFRVGQRIDSASLVGDAWNDAVDILSAGAALTALGLTIYRPSEFLAADHYGGCAVGLIVIVTGLRVARDASLDLMDTMPQTALIDRIRQVTLQVPLVTGVEKCYARKTGLQHHVDIHVEVDPDTTVRASHDIATAVRAHLRREIPAIADVLVHIEPASLGTAERGMRSAE